MQHSELVAFADVASEELYEYMLNDRNMFRRVDKIASELASKEGFVAPKEWDENSSYRWVEYINRACRIIMMGTIAMGGL